MPEDLLDMTGVKLCSKCSFFKDFGDFYLVRGKPAAECKACRSERLKTKREANLEFYRAKANAKYAENPKAYNARSKAQYAANPKAHRLLVKSWLKAHPDFMPAERKKHIARNREMVRLLKETNPCTDCGQLLPPWTTHFDHLDGLSKKFDIGRAAAQNTGLKALRAEIAKCELVCVVCHAHRTYCRQHGITHYILGTTPQGASNG